MCPAADDPVPALLAMIAADPGDLPSQQVLADHLLALGDPRGELLALDHSQQTTPGGMADPAAVERLLLLAAEYTFPRARDFDPPRLPFEGGGAHPVVFEVTYEGHHYALHYDDSRLSVTVDRGLVRTRVEYPDGYEDDVNDGFARPHEWSEVETTVTLQVFSDPIRAGTPLDEVELPFMADPLPIYPAGPLRCYRLPEDFTRRRGIPRSRYGLAARDYRRWHAIWALLRRR
jgi:hypothetical protein